MPWDMNDYPSSLKNIDKAIRKKAIDIANAMVDEGYSENRAIPIATEQAEEWYDNASDAEIREYKKQGEPKKRVSDENSNPRLLDESEYVVPHKDGWAVQAKEAKKAAKVFEHKSNAIDYGKNVARNKGTKLVIFKKNGDKEKEIEY